MSLKLTEELCVMTMKKDAKFEEEQTSRFKIDMKLRLLTRALESLKILHINGLFLTKVYNARDEKYREIMFDGTEY